MYCTLLTTRSVKDNDGDGVADVREDLAEGFGPPAGIFGFNDHIVTGTRIGMDGLIYISVGDKGRAEGDRVGRQHPDARRGRRDPHALPTARNSRSSRRARATTSTWR